MDQSFLTQYSVMLNPARFVSVIIFLVGFFASCYVWFVKDTGTSSVRFFLIDLRHNRRELLRRLFNEGPGYLLLPLWLIFATIGENYLGPMVNSWLQ